MCRRCGASAGGRPIKTPFGAVYSTNITPDPETGIGKWTEAEFFRAVRQGVRNNGAHLYPAFPYTTYTRMTDEDVRALKTYLFSVKPVKQANKPPEMGAPFRWRFTLKGWKLLFFKKGRFQPNPAHSTQLNRGAYLVQAVTNCAECHTPRNAMGGRKRSLSMAGTPDGPEGELAPNITPDGATGVGSWSVDDMAEFLKTGDKPDFDNVQGLMLDAIDHGYKHLTDADAKAIAVYLRTLKLIKNKVERKKKRK